MLLEVFHAKEKPERYNFWYGKHRSQLWIIIMLKGDTSDFLSFLVQLPEPIQTNIMKLFSENN